MANAFVARQPIFDLNQEVFGYEILYRGSERNVFDCAESQAATASTLLNSFLIFGLDNLTDNKPVFINFDERFLAEDIPTLFPSKSLVIEILETVDPTAAVIAKCRELHELGYKVALDDFIFRDGIDQLMDYVDIIKLDLKAMKLEQLRQVFQAFRHKKHLRYLAEKVEDSAEFEMARKIGCTLFQGYFFGRPTVQKKSTLFSMNTNYVSLLNAVNKAVIDYAEVSRMISSDVSLSFYLLKLINSPGFGMTNRVGSVRQALVAMGEREIKKWISLIVLNSIGKDKPDELLNISLIRARMAEQMALQTADRLMSDHFFLAGLFSLLDAILEQPFSQIVSEVNLPDAVSSCLACGNGPIRPFLDLVLAYEQGDWVRAGKLAAVCGLEADAISGAYFEALKWHRELSAA